MNIKESLSNSVLATVKLNNLDVDLSHLKQNEQTKLREAVIPSAK